MKPVRLLLIILGVLLALVLVAGGVALVPAVQRWAVLRAARGTPGLKFEVATVAAGPNHVSLAGVKLEKSGLAVELAQLEADYSLWQLLFSHRLAINRLTGQGLLVDASRLSRNKAGAAAAGAPAAAPGLLGQVELPFELVLGDCALEGRALLPGSAGGAPVAVDFKVTGGQLAPGQEGTLVLAASLKNPAAGARVTTLRATVSLQLKETDHRTFGRIGLSAVVDAEGRNLSGQEQLKATAALEKTATGENYDLSVDTLIGGVAGNLLTVHAALPAGGREYAGDWKVLAHTAQVEPFFLGAPVPDFNARGEGHFAFNPVSTAASLQGSLKADVSRLEVIDPAWRAIGSVKTEAQFDLAEADGVAKLNELRVSLAGDSPVLELAAARAAEVNFKEHRLQVGGSAPGEALTLTLHGLPLAWVRPFVQAADVSGGMITGQLTITGEADRLLLRAVQPLRIGQLNIVQAGTPLLIKADVALGFEAVLTQKELTALVSGFTLQTPAGDSLSAQAKIALPVGPDPSISVVAKYTADLPTLLKPWLRLGPVKAAGEADFTLAGKKLELRQLQAGVTDLSGRSLFKATSLQPFTLDLANRRAAVAGPQNGKMLLRFDFSQLPLAALPVTLPGAKLGGLVTDGELVLEADGDKVNLRAPHPFVLNSVSLEQEGRAALSGLQIELQPLVVMTDNSQIRFESGDVSVWNSDAHILAKLHAEATQAPATGLQGALSFTLEVPALATQPIFAGAQAVSAGRASGEVRMAFGATRQIEARLTVNGLVAAGSGATLPVANLSFRAAAQPDGKFSVQAPLLLDRGGQRSDLNFALDLTPAGRGFAVSGGLTGERVELADVLAVLGVFAAPAAAAGAKPPEAVTTAPAPIVADIAPPWSHFTGRLNLDVKSVVRGTEWGMTGLTGQVVIEPADVTLQKLEAAFGEKGRFTAKALLSFTKGATPYELTGNFSLTEFDAGKLFKALEPAKPPTVEGVFTVAGNFTGTGETLGRTLERSRGSFALTSRAGVFRGLQRTTNKVSMATKAVDLVGSLFGSSKVVEKVAGSAYVVDQLAQALGEFNYDQLSVKVTRDESLNVALEDISLLSPEIRLTGKGTVTYVADKPLLEQPLKATLSLAARGKVEEQFGKLRALSGARDELDYAKTKDSVAFGGTLLRPDPSAWFARLAANKLTDLLTPDN